MSHDPEINNTTLTMPEMDMVVVRTTFTFEAHTAISNALFAAVTPQGEIKLWQDAREANHKMLVAKVQNWLGEAV